MGVNLVKGLHQPRAFGGVHLLEEAGLGLALGRWLVTDYAAIGMGKVGPEKLGEEQAVVVNQLGGFARLIGQAETQRGS